MLLVAPLTHSRKVTEFSVKRLHRHLLHTAASLAFIPNLPYLQNMPQTSSNETEEKLQNVLIEGL
jgi:hypothetical protein